MDFSKKKVDILCLYLCSVLGIIIASIFIDVYVYHLPA